MRYIDRLKKEILWIGVFIAIIWLVFFLDQLLPFEHLGLRPRSFFGLIGIGAMTFLHGSWGHIIANTLPLITLLFLLVSSRSNSAVIVFFIMMLGGLLLWLLGGSGSVHIGASLLVFGLIGFLLTTGLFFERQFLSLLISLFVLFSYGGSLVIGVLPVQEGVSWEGHLYGFIAGIVVAYLNNKKLNLV